ncbi:MAG: type II secretion system protein [Verrucomicrobiae bacterium]|nr:type II secretion system protein [Verrucomicrobiae bacterium]
MRSPAQRLASAALRQAVARSGAFSLPELLVVLAVIGLLASLLLPGVMRTRGKGHDVACRNHLRQLAIATQLYTADSQGLLPYNLGAADTKNSVKYGGYRNWANNVLSWELDEDNTNTLWLARGGLGPYLGGVAEVFRCPVDRVVSDLQHDAGWTRRVRSFSMNAMIGNAGEFSYEGRNVNNPGHTQFFKEADVPAPARIFVFIEEHPDSINDGYFLNRLGQREWFDLPASWHAGSANLTFADGHAESRRWVSATTRPPPRPDAARLPLAVASGLDADFDWLMERTTVVR